MRKIDKKKQQATTEAKEEKSREFDLIEKEAKYNTKRERP